METPDANTPKKSHLWARDPNDWYVEEPWCWTAFFETKPFEHLKPTPFAKILVVDPFCGMGRVLDAAEAAGHEVYGCDRVDRVDRGLTKGRFFNRFEFHPRTLRATLELVTAPFVICSNPPYGGGAPDAKRDPRRARELFRSVVNDTGAAATALLLRTKWANGRDNSLFLENEMPLKAVYGFTPRPSMPPGAVVLAAASGEIDPKTGKRFKVSGGQEDYSVYLFEPGYQGPITYGWLRKPKRGARL